MFDDSRREVASRRLRRLAIERERLDEFKTQDEIHDEVADFTAAQNASVDHWRGHFGDKYPTVGLLLPDSPAGRLARLERRRAARREAAELEEQRVDRARRDGACRDRSNFCWVLGTVLRGFVCRVPNDHRWRRTHMKSPRDFRTPSIVTIGLETAERRPLSSLSRLPRRTQIESGALSKGVRFHTLARDPVLPPNPRTEQKERERRELIRTRLDHLQKPRDFPRPLTGSGTRSRVPSEWAHFAAGARSVTRAELAWHGADAAELWLSHGTPAPHRERESPPRERERKSVAPEFFFLLSEKSTRVRGSCSRLGGHVLDVSASRFLYGAGAPRALFAGAVADRALARRTAAQEDLTDDLAGLSAEERARLAERVHYFLAKFPKVGVLRDGPEEDSVARPPPRAAEL